MSCKNCDVMYKQIGRLCVSCKNKKDYLELSSEEKSIILLYESNIEKGNQSLALEALREMIKLGIDDITVPE